jgi:hypothetical protein
MPQAIAQQPLLISEEYRLLQQQMHAHPGYGMASVRHAPVVAQFIERFEATEVLDYGAGKGRLGEALAQHLQRPVTIHHYDPGVPEWSASPEPCAFVACIDVLEHIEPELIDNVLDDLQRVTTGVAYLSVETGPASKFLPDGRNAHLIQQPSGWWLTKLIPRFEIVAFSRLPKGFWVAVGRRKG